MSLPEAIKHRSGTTCSLSHHRDANGRCTAIWILLIALATLIAYTPVYRAGFIWDDDDYVQKNQVLQQDADGLIRIWTDVRSIPQWYPLVHTTYWIEYQIWGGQPTGYHLVNVLLHLANALLLARVLAKLGLPYPAPLIAGTLFALHPVHVESVAWITERKNTLSTFLYLVSALAYLRFDPIGSEDRSNIRSWRWWMISLAMFACALLSKTVVASLPAAILLVIWWKYGRIRWRDVLPLIPFFVIGIGMGLLTAWLEQHHVGASGKYFAMEAIDRLLLAGRVPWFYLRTLLFPYPLIFIYPKWAVDSHVAWQYLFPLLSVGAVAALWLARRKIGRGPMAAILFFGGTLFPVLGFVNVFPFLYSYVADHVQYLASVGPITFIAAIIGQGVASWRTNVARRVTTVFSLTLAVICSVLTFRQCGMYSNLETLWRTTIDRNPDAWAAHNNLAQLLIEQGSFQEATYECQRSLDLYEPSLEAHDNMAMLLLRTGHVEDAIGHMKRTIELQEEIMDLGVAGNYAAARYALGCFLLQQKQPKEAATYFQKALDLEPQNSQAAAGLMEARRQLASTGLGYPASRPHNPRD